MPKPPPPGLCVHCRRHSDDLTWDHVFPEAWYPSDTPGNLEKWKIPSCRSCNAAYGTLEQDLLLRLGMSIGPEEPKASGIAGKVTRSMDSRAARNERDRRARIARHAAIGREMIELKDPSEAGALPGFGPDPGPANRSANAILIPKKSLERLGEKIVRGLTYLLTGQLIGEDYNLEVFVVNGEAAEPVNQILAHHGVRHDRGPGIELWRAPAQADPVSAVFAIEIWGKLKLYAGVHPRELEDLDSKKRA